MPHPAAAMGNRWAGERVASEGCGITAHPGWSRRPRTRMGGWQNFGGWPGNIFSGIDVCRRMDLSGNDVEERARRLLAWGFAALSAPLPSLPTMITGYSTYR